MIPIKYMNIKEVVQALKDEGVVIYEKTKNDENLICYLKTERQFELAEKYVNLCEGRDYIYHETYGEFRGEDWYFFERCIFIDSPTVIKSVTLTEKKEKFKKYCEELEIIINGA